jgi:pimeloyl-ACP methyl ester carboxylesterase
MVLIGVAFAGLLLLTRLGVILIQRAYRPSGRMIDVAGGRLHMVELGPADAVGPPLILIHGASSNLESMRQPLGNELAKTHRVILIDRPGHGFSIHDRLTDSTPAVQAAMIDEALGKLGVARAIVVAHSWAGALGTAMALNHPARVAGLVMLAPVTHPWGRGGVAWYNELAARPLLGSVFAHTLALPIGFTMLDAGTRSVFLPQTMPANYIRNAAIALLMRPAEFLANAHDMVTLKAAVAVQATRYSEIKVPATVIAGDTDTTVSIDIHSRAFVAAVPSAELVVLPGIGHMTQNAATDVVVKAVDAMVMETARMPQLAMS